jgi:PAS domain S-box-containing protein
MTDKPNPSELKKRIRVLEQQALQHAREREQFAIEQENLYAKLSNAIEMAHLGPWEYDVDSDVFTFNDHFYKLFRTTVEQIGGYRMPSAEYARRFVHPDDVPKVGEEIRRMLESDDPHFTRQLEHRIIYADGQLGYISVRIFIRKDAAGRTVGSYGVNQDITERLQSEKERKRLQDQLNQAQKMESVGRLAGGVAHDFNNMLGIIIGHVELAMVQVTSTSKLHNDLVEIQKAAQRSADLTSQLLAFARKQTVLPKVLDLNHTITLMIKMLRRLIGEDIEMVWRPGADLWSVEIDPAQIDQILVNLCVNAKDAIDDGGKILIETQNVEIDDAYCGKHAGCKPGHYVMLAFSDNGCGVDDQLRDHLFEPFFTTKEVGKGTGLGLATVYGIVKQNKGYIYVYSEPGQGTTFKVYLPRSLEAVPELPVSPSVKIAKGTETILLVEDEAAIMKLTATALGRCGYTVIAASSPAEALAIVEQKAGPIDLLLTDVVMPGMNGRQLKELVEKQLPNIQTLYMSGYTAKAVALRGILTDDVHFLQKPFTPSTLARKVRKVFDKR